MNKIIMSVVCLLLMSICLSAQQQILVLEKQNMTSNKKIPVGQRISLKATEDEGLVTSRMIYLTDSTMYLENGYAYDFKEIDYLVITNRTTRFFSRFFYYSSIVGGIVMVNGLINGEGFGSPIVYAPLAVSAGLIGIGTGLKFAEKQKYHIKNGKWKLKVIDFESLNIDNLNLER